MKVTAIHTIPSFGQLFSCIGLLSPADLVAITKIQSPKVYYKMRN